MMSAPVQQSPGIAGDRALAIAQADALNVLTGNGTGAFQASVTHNIVGVDPFSVAVMDANGDGHADVVSANGIGTVSVLLGKGDGTLLDAMHFPTRCVGPRSVVVGDLDDNGHVDLVVSHSISHSVSVLLDKGNGKFRAISSYKVSLSPIYLTSGDFNMDGNLDVATADSASDGCGCVSVLIGSGNGTFQNENYAAGSRPLGIAAGDFNQDNFADLAVTHNYTSKLSVLLNGGDWPIPLIPPDTGHNAGTTINLCSGPVGDDRSASHRMSHQEKVDTRRTSSIGRVMLESADTCGIVSIMDVDLKMFAAFLTDFCRIRSDS